MHPASIALALLTAAASSRQSAWTPVREALGLRLDLRAADGGFRLVDERLEGSDPESERSLLCAGSEVDCQRALVEAVGARHGFGRANLPLATFGGLQLWSDLFWFEGWRIQEHAFTGHARLVDPRGRRVAWGTAAACRAAFERERQARGLVAATAPLAILLHGLGRTSRCFTALASALTDDGWDVASISYASTTAGVELHAERVARLFASLEGERRLAIVTHSMGGLVARRLFAAPAPWRARLESFVMIAPPNQGSSLARLLALDAALSPINGAGASLVPRGARGLPAPDVPFGIVALRAPWPERGNPLLAGANDWIVTVEETRLPGAADFVVVPGLHSFGMGAPGTLAAVRAFLARQSFDPSAGSLAAPPSPR